MDAPDLRMPLPKLSKLDDDAGLLHPVPARLQLKQDSPGPTQHRADATSCVVEASDLRSPVVDTRPLRSG